MKDICQDAGAGKTHQPNKVGEKALNTKDLTCQEAQLEELLSKGESTEGEVDEAQDEHSADRKPPK
jgi:hypothetical protein